VRVRISITLAAMIMAGSATSYASDSQVTGDRDYGEYLSGECVTCHQATGERAAGIPSITGWEPTTFVTVLKAYKARELENPVMQMITGRLDDEQMAALAVYFAELPAAD